MLVFRKILRTYLMDGPLIRTPYFAEALIVFRFSRKLSSKKSSFFQKDIYQNSLIFFLLQDFNNNLDLMNIPTYLYLCLYLCLYL